jgi:hypothetical protein
MQPTPIPILIQDFAIADPDNMTGEDGFFETAMRFAHILLL